METALRATALAAALSVSALIAAPALAATTLTVVEHAESDTVTDTGDEDDSPGDILTFANDLYDESNANKVGTDSGWCIRTVPGSTWECFWTATLGDGQITVEGPFFDDHDSVLAVTGGTGSYAGAKGEMTLHARNDEGTEYDFVYDLQ